MLRVWKGEAPILRSLLFVPLSALSGVYRGCLAAREGMYRTGFARVERARVPVVSVGNMTLGGTGKTPVVERLSRALKEAGFRPGIVMRGYRKKKKGVFAVDPVHDTAETAGDEAAMLSKRTMLPVIVGTKRSEGIEKGIRDCGIDMALFDDGYQVRDVHKDVELLVVNGQEAEQSKRVFPLGVYREPLATAKKADAILVNRGTLDGRMKAVTGNIPTFQVRYRPLHLFSIRRRAMTDYRFAKGKKVLAFSGLGDNASFFNLLREIGADVVRTLDFPDHHRYEAGDVQRIRSFGDVELLVTTEKDAVKLEHLELPENLFYLCVEAEIEREQELMELILHKISHRRFTERGEGST